MKKRQRGEGYRVARPWDLETFESEGIDRDGHDLGTWKNFRIRKREQARNKRNNKDTRLHFENSGR